MPKKPASEAALLARIRKITRHRQALFDERDALFALGRSAFGTSYQAMADAADVKEVTVRQTLRRRAAGKL